ncbi:hypothetical protein LDENG_00277220 [Lucifuga dentata]|nr:hypothetical protein LDENG_00277220 [Lucifuga dentata]
MKTHADTKIKSSSAQNTQNYCLFCKENDHSLDKCSQFKLKIHQEKMSFIKENGICFGCLKVGHTSKDCRSRLDCNVCYQKHPGVLHIERKDTGTSLEQAHQSVSPALSISSAMPQTCGHIGAGCEDDSVFSIVAIQVKSQKSNKVVQTYAFLDPGSSGTFCTDNLARKLNLMGKRTNILLRTMGQQKIVRTTVLTGLEVSGVNSIDFIELPNVLTQKTMQVSRISIPES